MNAETFALLLVIAMVPFTTTAAIVYLTLYPWRRSREGWALATVIASFALLIDLAVLYELVPGFPGKPGVRIALYALILAGQVQLAWSLSWRVWRARHAPDDPHPRRRATDL